jgi:hypothetical protein
LDWPEVIALVEEKIGRIEVKKAQLAALLATFRRQQAAGDPTPFEVAYGRRDSGRA